MRAVALSTGFFKSKLGSIRRYSYTFSISLNGVVGSRVKSLNISWFIEAIPGAAGIFDLAFFLVLFSSVTVSVSCTGPGNIRSKIGLYILGNSACSGAL